MKQIFTFALAACCFTLLLSGCVEKSKKFQDLQAQLDSLQAAKAEQDKEVDEVFAIINGIEDGLESIRESENIISVQTNKDGLNVTSSKKEQIMNDINIIQQALNSYQEQLTKLEKENKYQSAQYKKRLASLQKQLEKQSQTIATLEQELAQKNVIIAEQKQQISELGNKVSSLSSDVQNLSTQSEALKSQVASQDEEINTVYYVVGTKSELKESGVLSGGSLFKAAKISDKTNKENFVRVDRRVITEINTNSSKAKLLSTHDSSSYKMVIENGETMIQITDSKLFWEKTKYLVIQVW